MKNKALKIAGFIFFLMAAAQASRFCLQVTLIAGGVEIPFWISAVAAVILLILAIWMFKVAAK